MPEESKNKTIIVTPLEHGPQIPNPAPISPTMIHCITELLTEDEIQEAIREGDEMRQRWIDRAARERETA